MLIVLLADLRSLQKMWNYMKK